MEAFYLKYRPQTLLDLIGQESVKKTLFSAYQSNKLSHAYLLVGPRGTGKTSTARILAKMVNCEAKDVPCNKCVTCISITDGSNLDLIEIDAASNRGIDDIRALREKIKLSPTSARKKVYIIDEVHMLTTEAFNALLKTLEEPPKHALFILATTDVSKVPQTIISRVQRLDFKLASQQELTQALEKIIKMEKIDITKEALQILKGASQGSFRDAVKILDQVSSVGKKIDASEITKILHGTSIKEVSSIVENLANHDSKKSILLLNELAKYGVDFKLLTTALMEIMRALMLIKNDLGPNLVKSEYGSEQYPNLVTLADKFTTDDLTLDLNILQSALEKLKFTSIPQLPLELAVVEICGEETGKTLDDRNSKLDIEARSSNIENQSSTIQPQNPDSSIKRLASKPDETISADPSDILKLKEKWTFVLETIRPYNFSLEALLRSIRISECTDSTVILEVPYSFHQRILEAPKNRDLLESIMSDILGRGIRVSTILGSRPQRVEDVANIEVAADDEIIRAAAEIFNSDSVN